MGEKRNRYCDSLLHAYELGILSDEERKEFETHYLECDYCFESVKELQQVAWLLRKDPAVFEAAHAIVKGSPARPNLLTFLESLWATARQYALAKPIAVAALLIVLAIPTYILLTGQEEYQVIELLAVRGETHEVISLDKGGKVEIDFVFGDAKRSVPYGISIISYGGEKVYSDFDYSEFDQNGMGRLILPVAEFSAGYYKLVITDLAGKSLQEYPFKAQ